MTGLSGRTLVRGAGHDLNDADPCQAPTRKYTRPVLRHADLLRQVMAGVQRQV